jgi:trans-2,3-dihydro-3-hydroxyanthranilate isomerase
MSLPLHVVDVFAERAYAGNPLAVVIDERALSNAAMQRIAREMNHSETIFVVPAPEADGGFRARMFTPAREIAFAGHPIVGAAWVLRQHLGLYSSATLRLNLAVGQVEVTFERGGDGRDVAWFIAPPVSLGAQCDPTMMAAALGLSPHDLDPKAPVQQASAGTSAMIVPLHTLAALHRSRLDLGAYAPLAAMGFPPLVYLFCRETHDPRNDVCARFFFEAHGVREDPATGNGAAFLGAYLLEHGLFESGFSIRIEQGHVIHRPSLILLRGRTLDDRTLDDACEIAVGGCVVPTIRGELLYGEVDD